ncbi:MAG: hypothetical protein Q8Q40_07835 [Methylococcaceae bacterium]|nr:hypothetical protein [Methylococcaceae bacterium]MDP3903872.1 hypothetical protein [Methylococcaceae bacterium]
MGDCRFCEKPAGFLRYVHKECESRYKEGKNKIISLVEHIGFQGGNISSLEKQINDQALSDFIEKTELNKLIITGWEKAVERAFDDGVLTKEEEISLTALIEHFSLTQEKLDKNGAFSKIVKGAVLRDIFEGKIPERQKINGNIPFNLQKTEKVIWVFQDVKYYEQKKRTQYVGSSKGISVRIAKGVYYRTSAFKGERVETHQTIHTDTGLLGVTNKHIYFSGSGKSFRISHDKIVSFEPYSDGIGLQKDGVTAKPQSFVTGNGWFTYNLITNVAQL